MPPQMHTLLSHTCWATDGWMAVAEDSRGCCLLRRYKEKRRHLKKKKKKVPHGQLASLIDEVNESVYAVNA